MKKRIVCGYCKVEIREGAVECPSCKKKFHQKKPFLKWSVLLAVFLGSILLSRIIDGILSRPGQIFTKPFLIEMFREIYVISLLIILTGLISGVIALILSYGVIRLAVQSRERRRRIFMIIATCIVFGMFVIPFLYSPLELLGFEHILFPSMVRDATRSPGDDFFQSSFALTTYGIFSGLIVGIIIIAIQYKKKGTYRPN